MKKLVALALAAAALIVVAIAPATAPAAKRGPFAGAAHVDLVLLYRDGTTKTVSFDRGEGPKAIFKGVVHADITVTRTDGSTRSSKFDRGQITAIGGGSVTFKRPDGVSVTLAVEAKTVVREKGKRVGLDDLTVGDRAMFFSANGTARLVRCISRPA
jgi:hypothetical protein